MTHFAVIGLGKTGLSCIRFLKKHGAIVSAFDENVDSAGLNQCQIDFPDVKVSSELIECLKADIIVLSPGIPLIHPILITAKEKGIRLIGDIELFAQYAKAPILAITGTNGKTTTTTLLGHLIQASGRACLVGGNIGVPCLDLLEQETPDFYILELSSYQLDSTDHLNAKAGVVLNISEDHLDRYGNIEVYQQSKERLYLQSEYKVINRAVVYQSDYTENSISFGLDKPKKDMLGLMTIKNKTYLSEGSTPLIDTAQIKLKGTHNLENCLAALALAKAAGLSPVELTPGLASFKGLSHRCEVIDTDNGILWINDSKGTNIGATERAIQSLQKDIKGRLHLILGGQSKGQDFSILLGTLNKYTHSITVFGQDAPLICNALSSHPKLAQTDTLESAVSLIKKQTRAEDCVLFSPACASFDQFENFEARGHAFRMLIS